MNGGTRDYQNHGPLYEIISARHAIPAHTLLIRETPEAAKVAQAIAIASGYPLELHSETLLLKTPHTLAAG